MFKMEASVTYGSQGHEVALKTNDREQQLEIPAKETGGGARANGAELLCLALAMCYCNDVYREAAKKGIAVARVSVSVAGDYDGQPGSPLENLTYSAVVEASASEEVILALMRHTDTVAEIHNTLRKGGAVTLTQLEAVPV
jgi:uncharacterized OsmC-like protein